MSDAMKYQSLLLFGLPGCGKGTQGVALGRLPGFVHVACGDVFRDLSKHGDLGRTVAEYTSRGELVPDTLTIKTWRNHIAWLTEKGQYRPDQDVLVLDGLPRTYRQAEMLKNDLDVLRVLYLKLNTEEESIERIRRRALKENRIDDADDAVIRSRLETFRRDTAETIRFYSPEVLVEINASNSPIHVIADLTAHIRDALEEHQELRRNHKRVPVPEMSF